MKWHYTKDGDEPKPIENEFIPCVTYHCIDSYEINWWDADNNCWLNADDDSYDFDEVERWAYIEDEKYETSDSNV